MALLTACRPTREDARRTLRGCVGRMLEATREQYYSATGRCCSRAHMLWRVYSRLGVADLDPILEPLREGVLALMQERGVHANADDLTFAELHAATGVELHIFAADVDTVRRKRFCHMETPTVSVFAAIKASMSVGLLFPPCRVEGANYVDGALINNFPMSTFDDCHGGGNCMHSGTLGFLVTYGSAPLPGLIGDIEVVSHPELGANGTHGVRGVSALLRAVYRSLWNHVQFAASEYQHFSRRQKIIHRIDEAGEYDRVTSRESAMAHAFTLYQLTSRKVSGVDATEAQEHDAVEALGWLFAEERHGLNQAHVTKDDGRTILRMSAMV